MDGSGEQQKEDNSLQGQIQKLLTVLRGVKKDSATIIELEKKKDEFRIKYEKYKKLAWQETEEKNAKQRELDLLKKEKATAAK